MMNIIITGLINAYLYQISKMYGDMGENTYELNFKNTKMLDMFF